MPLEALPCCTMLLCAALRCAVLCAQGMQLVSCGPGRVSFTLLVEPQLQNRYGTLHGGAIGEGCKVGWG